VSVSHVLGIGGLLNSLLQSLVLFYFVVSNQNFVFNSLFNTLAQVVVLHHVVESILSDCSHSVNIHQLSLLHEAQRITPVDVDVVRIGVLLKGVLGPYATQLFQSVNLF